MATTETQAGKIESAQLESLRESINTEAGFDPEEIWGKSDDPRFSLKRVRESIRKSALREAVAETQFAQLVRYGVQKTMMGKYTEVPTIYQNIMEQIPSKTLEELFAPMYGVDVPVAVKDGEPAPESRLAGLDRRVMNQEFARILAISRRLVEDDQTGQIKRIAGDMGKRMKYAEENLALGTYCAIPATSEAAYKTNVAGQAAGTTAGPINGPNVEAAWNALTAIVDPLGNLILVDPDIIVVAKQDVITTRKVLESEAVTASPTGSDTHAPGSANYFLTKNVLKDMDLRIEASQFVATARKSSTNPSGLGIDATNRPWVLAQAMTSDAFVNRTPLEVAQEDPNSGDSFKNREYRYQMRRRFSAVTIDYLFKFFGN